MASYNTPMTYLADTPRPPGLDKQAKRVIGTLWMSSMLALGILLSPVNAYANDSYQFSGEIIIDEQTVAKPKDQIQEGAESYTIVQSDEYLVRLTYQVQSAGDNLLNARFIIEKDAGEGWNLLMQPSVQVVLGQSSSVSYEAPLDSDEHDVTFHFTFTSAE